MSRSTPLLAVLLAALPLAESAWAGSAWAAEPPPNVAETFGNTVLSVYPDGRSQKVWMQPDGSWTGLSRRGIPLAGHWTLKDGKVCLRQSKPPTLPISFCQVLPADMARGIDSKDILGTPIHLRLVKGVTETAG
jgi:hypothetical protein